MSTKIKTKEYSSNQEPKVGDKVRCSRDIDEGVDELFEVVTVGGGRMGNKVFIRPVGGNWTDGMELYYYCLCPQ